MPGDRQELRHRLQALAFEQAGYFTAAQARQVGYSYQAQKYHVDQGNWVRLDRGLFRLPHWPAESTDSLALWSVWSRGRGVVSHDSALAVYDLSDANPAKVHLTVPPDFRARHAHVRTHVGELPEVDVEHRRGFVVTTPERTLLDVAASGASQEIVDAAVSDAVRREATTPRRLRGRASGASDRAALGIERALSRLADES